MGTQRGAPGQPLAGAGGATGPSSRTTCTSPSTGNKGAHARTNEVDDLDVVVEHELPGMGPQPDRVDLVLPLIGDPGIDQVTGEDTAGPQELVVGLQCLQRLLE